MDVAQVLTDGFNRVHEEVQAVLDGMSTDQLTYRPDPAANPIGWLVWHLTRVQDDHLSEAFDVPQVWIAEGWAERADLPLAPSATGYRHTTEEVATLRLPPDLLQEYHHAVHVRTVSLLGGIDGDGLERIVDESWDPPVTLGVRLVSVLADDLQHIGQAAYVRGLLERSGTRP